ncbi:MAG: fibronectin type III domain-containing protein [Bdellovibrionales bacterium]|nr:fibronectin type III domain-containing protein [Bdellovibrionales bacterium]
MSSGGEGVGDSPNDETMPPTVGNAAIEFDPSSHDFGPAAQGTETLNKLISLTNTSDSEVYIANFEGTSDNFRILNSNCPTSPDPLPSENDCQMTLEFSPQTAGTLSTSLLVKYGAAAGSDDFVSIMGLSGTGVGSLNFIGINNIDQITHNSVRLNWPSEPLAVSFMIFSVVGANLNYVDTIVNTGGTKTSHTVSNLSPNTSYTFRVKAIDSLGSQDANQKDESTTTNPNQAPSLATIIPPTFYSGVTLANLDARDAGTMSDQDLDGDAITYTCYYDNTVNGVVNTGLGTCASLINESGGNPSFNSSTGIFSGWEPRHADVGMAFEFAIEGTDPYGDKSVSIFSGTVVAGSPERPLVLSVAPMGPANNNSPSVTGTAEPNMTINLFSNSTCTSAIIGTGTSDGAGNWSINATIADDSTTMIYAQAQNIIANNSDCSLTSVSYVEDSTPPSIIVLGTTPTSFGDSTTPTVNGQTVPSANVEVFSDSSCSTSEGTGTANGAGSFSITVSMASEETLTFYAKATDSAGNVSACSITNATYTSFPIDPTNLLVWVDSQDTNNMYQSSSCVGLKSTSPSDPIGCWKDKSGNNNNFTASSNLPVLADGILFNGTNNVLTNTTVPLNANSVISYFIYTRVDTQTTNSGSCCRPIVSWVTSSSGLYPWVGLTRGDLTPPNNLFFGWSGSGLSATPTSPGDEFILSIFHDGSGKLWNTFLDGTQTVSNYTIPATYTTTTNLAIGGDPNNAARLFKGQIMEVIIYSEILNSTRTQNMEGYLACKYDSRDQLPIAHPFYHPTGSDNTGCP